MKNALSICLPLALLFSACQKEPSACFTSATDLRSFITGGIEDKRTFSNCSTEAHDYTWDFGDGSSSSTVPAPTHTFTSVGTYTVTLTAQSENGRKESSTTETIVVKGRAVFFAATAQYPVTVTVGADTRQGFPTIVYNDCSSAVTFDNLPAGTYTYSASEQSPGTATWNGSFTISGTGCTQVDL